ncbi:MAG TPA: hypothetical protein DCR14_14985 [Acidimicrobiaceae bacterium]|nr:hypothetical protein [Acidimicrobiaceae bacterium]
MTHSDWDDGEEYPPAPMPAHERPWRHPSEVGMAAWAQSEPPLVIGRGLSVATGTVGVALAAAVLWALLPTHTGEPSVSSSRSTMAIADASALSATGDSEPSFGSATSSQPSPNSSTTLLAAPGETPGTGVVSGSNDTETSPPHQPTTTVAGRPVPTFQVTYHTATDRGAVAVALHEGRLVVTTAAAVDGASVELLTPDGGVATADVLLVDSERGLAVLSPAAGAMATSFTVAVDVDEGDSLTAWAEVPHTFTVGPDGLAGADCGTPELLAEGAPVTDDNGNLVALCTLTDTGSALVSLEGIDGLRRAVGAATPPTVWMGLMLTTLTGADESSVVVVSAVEAGGPAAKAGLDVGDTILTVGGVAVTSVADLAGVLALHQPGDVVSVVVECADGTRIDVRVELAPPKAAL